MSGTITWAGLNIVPSGGLVQVIARPARRPTVVPVTFPDTTGLVIKRVGMSNTVETSRGVTFGEGGGGVTRSWHANKTAALNAIAALESLLTTTAVGTLVFTTPLESRTLASMWLAEWEAVIRYRATGSYTHAVDWTLAFVATDY